LRTLVEAELSRRLATGACVLDGLDPNCVQEESIESINDDSGESERAWSA
jgi:hypothetical protein